MLKLFHAPLSAGCQTTRSRSKRVMSSDSVTAMPRPDLKQV
ncbi:MAG: hypothetical protein V8Q45_10645 [Alistipes onderdonkii]|jgi:hypothetical protein